MSGFFILFEHIYMVGDVIEVGGARGVVEAIEFRTTRIGDAEGRVHVIRNGDMKPVINYSKDYGVAIVAVDVPYGADLQRVFASLREAGERLRAQSRDVLAETKIYGITGVWTVGDDDPHVDQSEAGPSRGHRGHPAAAHQRNLRSRLRRRTSLIGVALLQQIPAHH